MAREPDIDLDADELFVLANADPRVRAGVRKVAAGSARRARKELARAGIDAPVTLRDRILSNGRTTVDVAAEVPEGKERQVARIMRRAGREGRGRR
ncbi:hypothetical protein [Corynebacterium sp. AOP34-BR1-29]|uniref:hypothetical protein n=1 Tax=Corynebacterium sp. AOP34-BR1-29 TaxID=3457688 RepID=UPI004034015B